MKNVNIPVPSWLEKSMISWAIVFHVRNLSTSQPAQTHFQNHCDSKSAWSVYCHLKLEYCSSACSKLRSDYLFQTQSFKIIYIHLGFIIRRNLRVYRFKPAASQQHHAYRNARFSIDKNSTESAIGMRQSSFLMMFVLEILWQVDYNATSTNWGADTEFKMFDR